MGTHPLKKLLLIGALLLLGHAAQSQNRYPYFQPGGDLSCSGACTTQSVIKVTNAAVIYIAPQTNADVAINAAITAAPCSTSGCVIQLGAGTYTLSSSSSPIVPASGVYIVGVAPKLNYTTNTSPLPDSSNVLANGGGTVINCAAGPCIQWNKSVLGVPASQNAFTIAALTNIGLKNLGFTNCTRAVDAGNTNNPSAWYSEFENLYISGCTDWGFWLTNFMHSKFRKIWSVGNTTGQMFFGNDVPSTTLQPGNSVWEDLFANTPSANTNLSRGIAFFVTQGQQNEGFISRLQSNRNGASTVTQAATMANASANITVTDGTKFLVGMPVTVSATANGFTLNQIYYVVSVATNVLQLSSTVGGTAITATGATAVNLITQGFPGLEIEALSGATISAHHFANIDVENGGTTAISVQNVQASVLGISQLPPTSGATISLTERNVSFTQAFTQAAANTDIDANSTSSSFFGYRAANSVQRNPPGHYFDQGANQWFMNLSGSVLGFTDSTTGDTTHVITPGTGVGTRITQVTTATTTLQAQNSGYVVNAYTGGTATWTLPSIASTAGNGQYVFDSFNAGAGTLTVNTNAAGQTFNNISGLTSITVAVNAGLRLVGIRDANGNNYWGIVGLGGAYSGGSIRSPASPPLLTGHLAFSGTAPVVSACGTSPSIDANATDNSGTVTVGSGVVASCTVTFNAAYATFNHCRVTAQPSVAAFAYSYTLSAITVTATSLTSDKFDYFCDGS